MGRGGGFKEKVELDNEGGLVGKLKSKIKAGNEKDWEEDVYMKSMLKWSRLANDGQGWRDV